MRRSVLAALILVAGTLAATAQDWPTAPVKIVVPFAAGATPDIVARLVADRLHDKLERTFIVENRPGASGDTGTDAVAKATPDGATIGVSIGGPLAINRLLFGKLPYDPRSDLTLITLLVTQPSVLAVNATLGVDSTRAMLDLVRRNPGKYAFGSIGAGSLSHLAMAAIALKSGTQLVHVPYSSSPQAMTALIRNDVQMVCLPAISVVSQVQTGKIRMLAVTTAKRSPFVPDLPTLKEGGVDVEANAWNGLIAPAKTPDIVVAAIAREVNAALHDPGIVEKLRAQYMDPVGTTPAEFTAYRDAEMARWTPVVQAAGLKPQ